jgi:hypothetical protein
MKNKLFVTILSYFATLAVIAGSTFAIYYSAKVHFLLAIFIVIICVLLIGSFVWYNIRLTTSIKAQNRRKAEFEYHEYKCVDDSFDLSSIENNFSQTDYVKKEYEDEQYKITYFVSRDVKAKFPTYIFVKPIKSISSLIDLEVYFRKFVTDNIAVEGVFRTSITLIVDSLDSLTFDIYTLNGPYGFSKERFFSVYALKDKTLYMGGHSELLFVPSYNSVLNELKSIFKVREGDYGAAEN